MVSESGCASPRFSTNVTARRRNGLLAEGGGYEVEAFLFARMNEVTTAFRLKDGCELVKVAQHAMYLSQPPFG